MNEYTCKKCGQPCVIEYDKHEAYRAEAWCDECNDHAAGFPADQYQADYIAGIADNAHDREKDRRMGL